MRRWLSATSVVFAISACNWVFDQPYFIILNLAVGGAYDGAPDDSTVFPSRMVVDYVKVFRLDPAM